jgi:hypothetical protein
MPSLPDRSPYIPAYSRHREAAKPHTAFPLGLRERIQMGRTLLPSVRDLLSEKLATYVRLVMALLYQAELGLSPRRGGMLLRNILAVHTARLLVEPDANLCDSALLALTYSFPQRALGVTVIACRISRGA